MRQPLNGIEEAPVLGLGPVPRLRPPPARLPRRRTVCGDARQPADAAPAGGAKIVDAGDDGSEPLHLAHVPAPCEVASGWFGLCTVIPGNKPNAQSADLLTNYL